MATIMAMIAPMKAVPQNSGIEPNSPDDPAWSAQEHHPPLDPGASAEFEFYAGDGKSPAGDGGEEREGPADAGIFAAGGPEHRCERRRLGVEPGLDLAAGNVLRLAQDAVALDVAVRQRLALRRGEDRLLDQPRLDRRPGGEQQQRRERRPQDRIECVVDRQAVEPGTLGPSDAKRRGTAESDHRRDGGDEQHAE
jgi:hypothetical protein